MFEAVTGRGDKPIRPNGFRVRSYEADHAGSNLPGFAAVAECSQAEQPSVRFFHEVVNAHIHTYKNIHKHAYTPSTHTPVRSVSPCASDIGALDSASGRNDIVDLTGALPR